MTSTLKLADYQAYSTGPFLAYIAPFNNRSYVFGKDYTENITIQNGSLTSGVVMTWDWPLTPCLLGIYDFSAIDYGYDDNTIVQAPVPPATINNIQTLTESHNLSFSGMVQGFDVIDDLFLTAKPQDESTQALEMEVFLHTPTYSAQYVSSSTPIGTVQVSGVTWNVALVRGGIAGLDALFMPANQADISTGTIDLKSMLHYLVAQGVIPGTLYFNGFALGTETQQGSGSMRINSLSVDYSTNIASTPATDTLTLRMSEDAYLGDAQFIVKLDGTQIGGTMTASALNSSGDRNVFVLTGNWATGSHQVAIQFLNDAYGGSSRADRNLYVDSIAYNGQTGSSTTAALYADSTRTFTVGSGLATASGPPDTVTLHLSEDAWNGNAEFLLLVDGKAVTTRQQVVALHSAGAWEDLSFSGNFGVGSHTIGVRFVNDAYGGSPTEDRNVYVNGIDVNGTHHGSGVTALMADGIANFTITSTH